MFEKESNQVITNTSNAPGAFVGKSGRLYVRVRRVQSTEGNSYTQQTAVYPSVKAYNTRSARPEYVELSTVINDYKTLVSIDMQTLTINFD